MKILKEEKPWTWNDPGLQPFANHLSLTGHLGTNKWEYDSIYPDPKIARLMDRIRKELKDSVPN